MKEHNLYPAPKCSLAVLEDQDTEDEEVKEALRIQELATKLGKSKEQVANGRKTWRRIKRIGGSSIYMYMQFSHVSIIGWALASATFSFQMFCFWIFFIESYKCGVITSDDCNLQGGVLIPSKDGLGAPTFAENPEVSMLGVATGCAVAILFILPEFMKGLVFMYHKFLFMSLAHVLVSVAALTTSLLFCLTTAVSDVSILTNVVVLLFITDIDERMYQINHYARTVMFRGTRLEDVVIRN
mmetsp:Transcript_18145/g.29439  ORF Transcript_18145/g.29439 Transcript_18145/m.29439 type:complete len:241 (+) Transcript_18145:7-729(+)